MDKLKKCLKIILFVVLTVAFIGLVVVPFLQNVISYTLAQYFWYISLGIVIVGNIIVSIIGKKINKVNRVLSTNGLILAVVIFTGIFIVNYYNTSFSWYWFAFVLVAVMILLGAISLGVILSGKSRNKSWFSLCLQISKSVFFYILIDLFYMSLFNKWIVCQFVFGGLSVIIALYNLCFAFLGQSPNNKSSKVFLLLDFLIGIALTIYLIYITPTVNNLQSIVTTIIAAIYGGLLTLVGVAWTIRKQDEIRRDDEKKGFKPHFNIYHGKLDKHITIKCFEFDITMKSMISFDDKLNEKYILGDFIIENTDFADFYFVGLSINGVLLLRDANLFIKKSSYAVLTFDNFPLYMQDTIKSISIIVKDLMDNHYAMELGFENDENDITIKGIKSTTEFSLDF